MTNYGFTLQLDRSLIDEEWFDQFTESIFPYAPDCTVYTTSGVAYVGFDRDAPSLREAIISAIDSVHRADPTVTVVGVVLDDGQPIDDLLRLATT